MVFNRRHKAILFVTLVSTGCALLLGAELKEALGFMMLGSALAWAMGSGTASKFYTGLKATPGRVYPWIRPVLMMTLAGALIGALMLFSVGNPVAVIGVSCFLGIFGAPFTQLATERIWLKIPIALVAACAFVFASVLVVETDVVANNKYGTRFGELLVVSLIAVVCGIFWLSKGWRLIIRGMTPEQPAEGLPIISQEKHRTWPQYISVFVGLGLLTAWLCVISWSASSNWAYAPEKVPNFDPKDNLLLQVAFVILLARWPFGSWKKILDRQPNSEPRFMKWHKRVTAVAGMGFTLLLGLSVTFGIQNGHDRILTEKTIVMTNDLKSVATKIGAIKARDMQTAGDYIQAYSEVEALVPELQTQIDRYDEIVRDLNQRDARRGSINIQRFYKSYRPAYRENLKEQALVVHALLSVTKEEVEAAKQMRALPLQYQPGFWKESFRPLLIKDNELREKALALDAEHTKLLN
jgi:hypothetical protein